MIVWHDSPLVSTISIIINVKKIFKCLDIDNVENNDYLTSLCITYLKFVLFNFLEKGLKSLKKFSISDKINVFKS